MTALRFIRHAPDASRPRNSILRKIKRIFSTLRKKSHVPVAVIPCFFVKFMMAAVALICMTMVCVSLAACSSDDDGETNISYKMGFSSVESSSLDEMARIESVFKTAIGVSSDTFSYSAGEDKLRAACNQAKNQLANEDISGKYTFEITKVSSKGTSTFFSWSNK